MAKLPDNDARMLATMMGLGNVEARTWEVVSRSETAIASDACHTKVGIHLELDGYEIAHGPDGRLVIAAEGDHIVTRPVRVVIDCVRSIPT
jgi:hypothetical protein